MTIFYCLGLTIYLVFVGFILNVMSIYNKIGFRTVSLPYFYKNLM